MGREALREEIPFELLFVRDVNLPAEPGTMCHLSHI